MEREVSDLMITPKVEEYADDVNKVVLICHPRWGRKEEGVYIYGAHHPVYYKPACWCVWCHAPFSHEHDRS